MEYPSVPYLMSRFGFTAFEILLAMAVLGILVSIALPRFADVREKSHVQEMHAALWQGVHAQLAHSDQHPEGRFTAGMDDLREVGHVPPEDVEVAWAPAASYPGLGVGGLATHRRSRTACVIAYGRQGPHGPYGDNRIICEPTGPENISVWPLAPAGISPRRAHDCKEGGWEDFGFRNQGLCLQFVNTGIDSRNGGQGTGFHMPPLPPSGPSPGSLNLAGPACQVP